MINGVDLGLLNSEDEGSTFLPKVDNYLPGNGIQKLRIFGSSIISVGLYFILRQAERRTDILLAN
jgi:hypothetical protein